MKIKIELVGTVYQTDLQCSHLSVTVLKPTIKESLLAAHAKYLNIYWNNWHHNNPKCTKAIIYNSQQKPNIKIKKNA
jgi:hypothetical protein